MSVVDVVFHVVKRGESLEEVRVIDNNALRYYPKLGGGQRAMFCTLIYGLYTYTSTDLFSVRRIRGNQATATFAGLSTDFDGCRQRYGSQHMEKFTHTVCSPFSPATGRTGMSSRQRSGLTFLDVFVAAPFFPTVFDGSRDRLTLLPVLFRLIF